MKFRTGKPVFWTLITAASLSAATLSPDSKEGVPDLTGQLAKLSDDSYAVRENATRELWKLGEAALPELQRVARAGEPEAAIRARDLVRKIELGILPDSSPKIVDLVMSYDRGSKDLRQRVIRLLRTERAYRQILKLYALEKDRETLAMLEMEVKGVALDAARECLSSEPPDIRSAFEYLKMARPDEAEYMAIAGIHRAAGTLDEAIRQSGEAVERDHRLRFCLLACAGRLDEAANEAEQAGLSVMAARLRMLNGDPMSWLALAPTPPQVSAATGLPAYREMAASLWRGEKPQEGDLRELRRLARSGDEDDQLKNLMLLFLAGDHAEAEQQLTKLNPTAAFTHFENSERVDEAFKAIGIDPAEPDYSGWARRRFHVFLEAPETERNELVELEALGSFLERRGLYRELEEAFVPPLVELAESDQDDFLMLATRLFPQGSEDRSAPVIRPVLKAAAVFGGDDDARWTQVVEHLFDAYGSPAQVWNWLAQMEPEMDRGARLELLCKIHMLLPDPGEQRPVFLKKAWALVEKAEKVERRRLVEVLVGALSTKKDPELLLRCIAELEDVEGARFTWDRYKGEALMALGRWNEAAELWMANSKTEPGEPYYRIHAAVCLRRAGNESAAAEQEAKADLLCLGETRALFQCGEAFAVTGDFVRAQSWWRRALNECTGDYIKFSEALHNLTDIVYLDGDWKMASTLREAGLLDIAVNFEKTFRLTTVCQKSRVEAEMVRGFALLSRDRSRAIEIIRGSLDLPYADTALADYFFEPMRAAGLVSLHDEAFEKHWQHIQRVIQRFPEGDNSRNSAAWLASRANRRLDEAEKLLTEVLKTSPHQGPYLDTMAEIHFARGDRDKALEYSEKVLKEEPDDIQLIRQYQRFKSAPFPAK